MYEAFYGLKVKPFSLLPDPHFLYWAGPHSMAFAMLEYGVMNHAGFTVISGEIGSGKTTLIKHLLKKLSGNIAVGLVSNIHGERADLLNWVLMAFGQDFEGRSAIKLHRRLADFLVKRHEQNQRTVLIIDEAQNLGEKTLEELRILSNINEGGHELLQIILSGQPELKSLLSRPSLVQFAQRVSSDFHLGLLAPKEVPSYIDHRLAVAGATRPLFSDDTFQLIFTATKGTPRLINLLCDTALMYGFATGAQIINLPLIQGVLRDKAKYGILKSTFALQQSNDSLMPTLTQPAVRAVGDFRS
jgi:general secretion pathway protein A